MNWLIQVANKTNIEVSEIVAAANISNFEEVAWSIINDYCIMKSNYEFAEAKILELYDEEMEFQENIPAVDDIVAAIESFNVLQVDRAVEIMMRYGPHRCDPMLIDNYYEDRAAMYFDYFYSSFADKVSEAFDEEAVSSILMKNKKTYILSYDDLAYADISVLGDAEYADVIINDCQESMLPEFNIGFQMLDFVGDKALFLYNCARIIKKPRFALGG